MRLSDDKRFFKEIEIYKMTSLIKNQILKHLTKFFKDLAPEQLQLSAFKGSCELSNLQLEEKVLMELLSFPAWIKINKATCDQLSIKIPWTKIKSVPIQMNLNEVSVEVEVCDEFRDIKSEDEVNLANLINAQAPGKYGFVDRVIDGITVTVNSVLITFKSKLMSATFNLSRVILESRCPNWKPGELSLTRIKDPNRSQILLFKIVEWQTMRLEAKCLTDPLQAPLRLITNHAQCRLTIKKKLDDCSVIAARIFVIFEDILWVLTFAQFISAASFVEYVFTLIKKSPISKKTGIFDQDQPSSATQSNTSSSNNSIPTSSFGIAQSAPLISPMNTPVHSNHPDKAPILTGNMSSASLIEQKFICYDLIETSLHLYIDKVDAHLYDDIEIAANSSDRDSGGALQTTFDQIQVDCYPYSRALGDRKHWYKWFDPSPNSRRQWLNSHFAEFDLQQVNKIQEEDNASIPSSIQSPKSGNINTTTDKFFAKKHIPTVANEQLLSLTLLVKIKDYCMHCVATKNTVRGAGLNKFIQTDKDYHMPSEMPSLYLELDYFYYFDTVNRMMVYSDVPEPLAFVHLSPTKLLFDSLTLLFLNSFQVNLSKALVHLNDLFPDETSAPKIHCRIEILMPQISLPAKPNSDQPPNSATSTLLVKSGKVTLSNSIYDKNVLAKLLESIDKLKENPSQPINLGGNYQTHSARRENLCIGDWNKVWNESLIGEMNEVSPQNQLWALQFEPVWMDFMNFDVDDLSNIQRLEPIVEPVNAYAFIHLNLTTPFSNALKESQSDSEKPKQSTNKRDIISILLSVMDGSILANMDKIQFGFLQRLGMHIEKLIQQIKADASSVLQMDTVIEDTLELNLTAYIKDIKARLILDKKVETQKVSINESSFSSRDDKKDYTLPVAGAEPRGRATPSNSSGIKQTQLENFFFNSKPALSNPFIEKSQEEFLVYSPGEPLLDNLGEDLLDECAEAADDASCLLLVDNQTFAQKLASEGSIAAGDAISSTTITTNTTAQSPSAPISVPNVNLPVKEPQRRSLIEESLLINLDEMEQSSSIFAKVNLKSQTPSPNSQASPQPEQKQQQPQIPPTVSPPQQQQQQEIETESISYLELSMSQLMVRRITETKRRQKY